MNNKRAKYKNSKHRRTQSQHDMQNTLNLLVAQQQFLSYQKFKSIVENSILIQASQHYNQAHFYSTFVLLLHFQDRDPQNFEDIEVFLSEMKANQHSLSYEIDDSHTIDMKTLRLLKKFLIVTTYQRLSQICPKFLLELSPVLKILKIDLT